MTAAPRVTARMLEPAGAGYDILEGQWLCADAAEATYYCVHNWYDDAGAFRDIADGSGYAGFQWKDGAGWTILSLWDNDRGRAEIEYAPPGSVAEPFGGEGTGMHVLVPCPFRIGQWYTLRVQARTDAGRTRYEQWIRPEGGVWRMLAAISYPRPGLGFSWDCFFLEDWAGNGLLRSCRLRGYYARRRDGAWQSLDRYAFSHDRGGSGADCGFGRAGDDAVWISSGGGAIPATHYEISVAQAAMPETRDILTRR